MNFENNTLLAIISGIVPALLWLWYWLRHDKKNPEPKFFIAITFFTGVITAFIAIPIEELATNNQLFLENYFADIATYLYIPITSIILVFYSTIEEVLKFLGAYFSAIRRPQNNEAIDNVIYLITAALGFAAMENILFVISAINSNGLMEGLLNGNTRFLGAMVLHTIASGMIGVFMALAYQKNKFFKFIYLIIGIFIAIALHTIFNSFIMNASDTLLPAFSFVWFVAMILILFIDRIKRINRQKIL